MDHIQHCHGGHHHHHHLHDGGAEGKPLGKNILVAFFLNLGFAIVELIGGLYTGSVAILSDALHDVGDALSLGFAWYLERLSGKKRDNHFSYGYKRFSLLSALLISLVLIAGAIIMIVTALGKILNPDPVNASGMFLFAILGVAVNGYAAWRMMGANSLSDKALRLHLLEDVMGWIAVLVVSVVMYFVDIPILDPLLSIAISLWILYNASFNVRDTFRILLQGVPEGVDTVGFLEGIKEIEGVLGVHDLHLWTMNGEEHIASVHVVYSCERCASPRYLAELKANIRMVAHEYGLNHLTIELDPKGQSCGMETC